MYSAHFSGCLGNVQISPPGLKWIQWSDKGSSTHNVDKEQEGNNSINILQLEKGKMKNSAVIEP